MGDDRNHHAARGAGRKAWFLFLIALLVRLLALARVCLISRDGITYVSLAKLYGAGEWLMALNHPYHPLYPLLTGWVGRVIGEYQLAGQMVSLVLGSATVVPLFFIGTCLYGNRVGFVAGLLLAFQPYCVRFSVDVLSDPSFLFFFVLALWLGLCAGFLQEKGFWLALAAGASGGLAYLTRPEGGFVLLLLAGWYAWRFFSARGAKATLARCGVALVLSFLLVTCPYLLYLKASAGSWQISAKPSVAKALSGLEQEEGKVSLAAPQVSAEGADEPRAPFKMREPVRSAGVLESLGYPLLKFVETFHYVLFVFLLLALSANDKRDVRNYRGILFLGGLGYLLCLSYLLHVAGYVSRRHFLVPIALGLPLASQGFWIVRERLAVWKWAVQPTAWRQALSRYATLVLGVVTIAILAPKALVSQGADKLPLKEAGLWIREHTRISVPVVMCNEPLVAYYAGGKHLPVPGIGYEEFVEFVGVHRVAYLVFEERDLARAEQFLNRLEPEKFRKVPLPWKGAVVYEVSGGE